MYTVVFVNTRYQFQVFLDILNAREFDNLIVLAPIELFSVIEKSGSLGGQKIFFDELNCRMGFFQSRRLLKIFKRKLNFLKNCRVNFLLANDDHILAQFLVRHAHVCDVSLFEDGLGSYVDHRPMMLDMGMRGVLSKLKKIVLFFPYYRSFLRFGYNFKASTCYSYNEGCFLGQASADRVLLKKTLVSNPVKIDVPEGTIFFVGQPLVEAGFVSSNDYRNLLLEVVKTLSLTSVVVYKPHPNESDFSKIPEPHFVVSHSSMPLEQEIESLNSQVELLGFYSTVLLNCLSSEKVLRVKSIRSTKINVPSRYYDALRSAGCLIVDV